MKNTNLTGYFFQISRNGNYPHLVDEWQEVPSIWDAVRYKVDSLRENLMISFADKEQFFVYLFV